MPKHPRNVTSSSIGWGEWGGPITIEELSPELADMIIASSGLVSNPPVGCFKVTNIYVDQDGKLVVKWSDTPQGA